MKDDLTKLRDMEGQRRQLMSESEMAFGSGFSRSGHRYQDEADEVQERIDAALAGTDDETRAAFEAYLERLKF